MIRRLLGSFLVLVVVVVVGAVVPLGLQTASHYRRDYVDATLSQSRAIASVLEERLSDHPGGHRLTASLNRLLPAGEGVAVLDRGRLVAERTGLDFRIPESLKTGRRSSLNEPGAGGESILVVRTPLGLQGEHGGSVLLARSTEPLEGRIRTLWLTLAAVAAAACLIAAALAAWLSGWVSGPLRRLESAAHAVGMGQLDRRVGTVHGPPEVRRLASTFDTMAARLDALVAGQRGMVADVSHQLRTPLSALRLRLELLADQGPQSSEEVQAVLDEVNRLSRLLDGLLTVARAESTTAPSELVDIVKVVAERVEVWAAFALERGIALEVASGEPVMAWLVRDHLDQILDNLLANCFDLSPAPRRVAVEVVGDGSNATISIADDGPGMNQRQRERAFLRFNTSRSDTGGSGLGLAIVHRLVTVNGGSVTLSDTPGGGLTVVIRLAQAVASHSRAAHG